MTPLGYETVKRTLSRLHSMVPSDRIYSPLLTRAKIACAVDANLNVHAVRTAPTSLHDKPELRSIEVASLAPDGGEPSFSPISPPVFNPAFPVISARGDVWAIGFVGARTASDMIVLLRSYEGLITSFDAGGRAPAPVMEKVTDAIRIAVSPKGSIYVLGLGWYPPPALPLSFTLRLAVYDPAGRVGTLADPMAGTDTPGSYPNDVALHASADGRVHVVYDGLREGMSRDQNAHLYHVILDGSGKQESVRDLGEAPARPSLPVLTRIVPAPDRRLFLLDVYTTGEDRQRFDHTLTPLEALDDPGPNEQYFVDYWLQPHRVWFDAAGAHYQGPEGVPPVGTP